MGERGELGSPGLPWRLGLPLAHPPGGRGAPFPLEVAREAPPAAGPRGAVFLLVGIRRPLTDSGDRSLFRPSWGSRRGESASWFSVLRQSARPNQPEL